MWNKIHFLQSHNNIDTNVVLRYMYIVTGCFPKTLTTSVRYRQDSLDEKLFTVFLVHAGNLICKHFLVRGQYDHHLLLEVLNNLGKVFANVWPYANYYTVIFSFMLFSISDKI